MVSFLKPLWQAAVSDYVTALDWRGDWLAIAAAAGEVRLQQAEQSLVLRAADGQSIDCLQF
ncbi:MAG: WD40 repeat domain-containing protein, partial [Alkalinema sp. RL_2_19]|nr:WD40 repeat domain-containing protein [Alkalinema sp. RL_2_19]